MDISSSETPLKGKGGTNSKGWEAWRNGPLRAVRADRSDAVVDDLDASFVSEASGGASVYASPLSSRSPLASRSENAAAPEAGSAAAGDAPPHRPAVSIVSASAPSLFAHFMREISWGHALLPRRHAPPAEHMLNFLRVTFALEPFLSFGHALCVDLFLFHFTLLPLRCVAALATLFGACARYSVKFTNAHVYDLIKGALLVTAATALGSVQVSRVYHYIRGEAIIKLYVIFNILEIFDKLACSLGQDVMDGLYRTTRDHIVIGGSGVPLPPKTRRRAALRLAFHFSVAVCYVVAHALILFVQIVCLNVAINSRNNALFTLLISNNFMELKASVFKKFEAENLFQVACSDAVERFQLGLFLVLIAVQELRSANAVASLLPPMIAIYLCEVRPRIRQSPLVLLPSLPPRSPPHSTY